MRRSLKEGRKLRQRFAFTRPPIETMAFVQRTVWARERRVVESYLKQAGSERKEIIRWIQRFTSLRFRRAIGCRATAPSLPTDSSNEVVVC